MAVTRRQFMKVSAAGLAASSVGALGFIDAGDALAAVFGWAQRHLDRDLTISSLAAKARMSRRTFIRRFEDATGMSPGEWVVQTRVAKARELLEATRIPIEGVATETGFGSADAIRWRIQAERAGITEADRDTLERELAEAQKSEPRTDRARPP